MVVVTNHWGIRGVLKKGADFLDILTNCEQKATGLRPSDVADMIGCSEYTVRKLVREGILPHYRIGNKMYFKRESILRWIDKEEYKSSHNRY